MAIYVVQNKWDGSTWQDGGVFNIGNRQDQLPAEVNIMSVDHGRTLTGTMTYVDENPIGLQCTLTTMSSYRCVNQWGGRWAPWHDAGQFLLGALGNHGLVALQIKSADRGHTFTGTMTHAGQNPVEFMATLANSIPYAAKNVWGNASGRFVGSSELHPGGEWVLGCSADGRRVVALSVTSDDEGATLKGTMTYVGEGPIGFRGKRTMVNTYVVENQRGGSSAPWIPGGTFVLGCRGDQGVVSIQITSNDDGASLEGQMIYAREGVMGLSLKAFG